MSELEMLRKENKELKVKLDEVLLLLKESLKRSNAPQESAVYANVTDHQGCVGEIGNDPPQERDEVKVIDPPQECDAEMLPQMDKFDKLLEFVKKIDEKVNMLQNNEFPALHENVPVTTENNSRSYAAAAKKPAPRAANGNQRNVFSKKTLTKLVATRGEPLEFKKLWLKIADRRPLMRCRDSTEVNELLNAMLKHLGIRRKVLSFSRIGNTLLEIYFPALELGFIMSQLAEFRVETVQNFDVTAIPAHAKLSAPEAVEQVVVKRLAHLVKRNKLKKMRECILLDVPENTARKVMELAAEMERKDKATAQLVQAGNIFSANENGDMTLDVMEPGEMALDAMEPAASQFEGQHANPTLQC
jgi:hypothetical protein